MTSRHVVLMSISPGKGALRDQAPVVTRLALRAATSASL